jgi:hypothetical protein
MSKHAEFIVRDQMLYFIKANFGHLGHLGQSFVETDPDHNSRLQVIADLYSGEIKNPLQIIECNPVEHVCNDITLDVAHDLYAHIHDSGEPCPAHLRDFLDLCLGASAADHLDIATGNFNPKLAAHRIQQAAQ